MKGKLCEVSEESSERCGDNMQNVLHRAQAVPSIPSDVVSRFLHRAF